jgi:hypothetical protein
MNTVAEVDEEAQEEAERPDEAPLEDGEQTPEEAAQTEGSHELAGKLEKENERHIRAVVKLLGPDMEGNICPTCDGFGFADAEQRASIDAGLPDDFKQPENYKTCEGCNGYGEVKSGAKNPNYVVVTCTQCSGKGYVIEAAPVAHVTPLPVAPATSDQPIGGQYVPGRGFIPYGATEPIPGTA